MPSLGTNQFRKMLELMAADQKSKRTVQKTIRVSSWLVGNLGALWFEALWFEA
jgi:hypothetical protein